MKYLLALVFCLFALCLFAQAPVSKKTAEKGVTPLSPLTVDRKPAPPAGRPLTETYAVVVGISDYQDEGIPDLRFADKDAEAFSAFLQSPAGGSLDEDHLKVLINEQATAAQFAIALDWLWEVVQEKDRVLIYFSGHGDVERKSITQPGYLLCWDAPSQVYMAGGAFDVRDLNDVVSTLSIQNKAKVVLITDACRAGTLSGSSIGGAQATAANLAKQFANEIKILSCQPDEYSIEGEQWGGGRGAFSYHLLDGLTGMADRDFDNIVDLKEIGRYLEDYVTGEVAPQSQNPMVIGNRTEKVADVFPDILAQLKAGKKGQLQLFTSTISKGIEDEVLAAADSSVTEMYLAFKKSLSNKNFLCDSSAVCAEWYYEKLSQEPQLEKLHSTMRRNYAAALQDDAQQVLNTILKSGLTDFVLRSANEAEIYQNYPDYLNRAAQLLGEDHYMYSTLLARMQYFKGVISKSRKVKISHFQKALQLEPEMPHAMVGMMQSLKKIQKDSIQFYFQKATALIPKWVKPYLAMAYHYQAWKDLSRAEEMLDLAEKVDSNSILMQYRKGKFYSTKYKNFEKSEKYYLKAMHNPANKDICFSCLLNNLGSLYTRFGHHQKAIDIFEKLIVLDPSLKTVHLNLCFLHFSLEDWEALEPLCLKSLELDFALPESGIYLAKGYLNRNKINEALNILDVTLQKDSMYLHPLAMKIRIFKDQNEMKKIPPLLDQIIATTHLYDTTRYVWFRKYDVTLTASELEDLGYDKEAEMLYQSVLKNDPAYIYALDFAIKYYSKQGKDQELLTFIESAMKADTPLSYFEKKKNLDRIRSHNKWKELMTKYFPKQKDE